MCIYIYIYVYCFPGSSSGKKSSYNAGDTALSQGREDPLVKGSFIYIYIYIKISIMWIIIVIDTRTGETT